MTSRWLLSPGLLLSLATLLPAQTPPVQGTSGPILTVGHLLPAVKTMEGTQAVSVSYTPRPGDIILYDDFNKLFHLAFKLASTAPPTHTAIVIAGADGKPALLELTGPKVMTARVSIMDVETRFKSYPGTVMVRKIREPLTPEQSRDLTQFAEAQVGKAFAWPRVFLQATPFCPRTGLRKELFGATYTNRNRWFCSELVVAACATAKILDGKQCCANSTYPRDLAYDETLNLTSFYHPPAVWTADGPLVEPSPVRRASLGFSPR